MVYCCVVGCKSDSRRKNADKKMSYFKFPKDKEILKKWIIACGRNIKFNVKNAKVCTEHFLEEDYRLQDILLKVPETKRRLKVDAVPTKNLPKVLVPSIREKRNQRRRNKQLVEECLSAYDRSKVHETFHNETIVELTNISGGAHEENSCVKSKDVATQTEIDYECSKELYINKLENEIRNRKAKYKRSEERLKQSEAMNNSVRKILTEGQVKRLQCPGKNMHWNRDDISSAILLYSAGPEAYRLLQKRNFPLPSSATLRGWSSKLNLKPEVLERVITVMSSDVNLVKQEP